MHRSNQKAASLGRLLVPAFLGAATLGACSDLQPVAPRERSAPPPVAARTLQAFDCTGSIRGGVSCKASGGSAGGASGVIIGGQNTYIKLTSTNVSYDSVTSIFQFDVTVKNLMNEAMGTPDGVTPDPEGIRVFFHSGPTVTSGNGYMYVLNQDGNGDFTETNQPYFEYHEILAKDEVSSPRTWQFEASPDVDFTFFLLVETDVQHLLVINEILANPGGTISDASGEWFEVYNAGTREVQMQGLVIADSAASGRRPYHLIASPLVIQPGGYVVLGNTANTTSNGGVPVDYAYGAALALTNSVDAVKISRVYGADTLTLDRTQYTSAAISAQNGISRELMNPALDNSDMDGGSWADALSTAAYGPGGRGTPKAQNSTFTP